MKISLLQTDIVWGNPEANFCQAEQLIAQSPQAGLYVLPEMFDTGFNFTPTEGRNSTACLAWMKNLATKYNAAFAASTSVCETSGARRNRFYFVTPEQIYYYDKHHLFSYAGEDQHFSPGDRRVTVLWHGMRFLLQVCYDLRFPIWARNAKDEAEAYDCILYIASWPAARRTAWDTLLKARAIENQCYVCGVNRVGKDPHNTYSGGTTIIGPEGNVIAAQDDHQTGCITAELTPDVIHHCRKSFPILRDRD